MGALTEREIFSCLEENCRLAIDSAEQLAKSPIRGTSYDQFGKSIDLIIGCLRQACYWRQDARWLTREENLSIIYQMSGNWLRGVSIGQGPKRRYTEGQLHPCFSLVADKLREMHKGVVALRDSSTGRVGMILPRPVENFRETRPHRVGELPLAMMKTPAGLIVPSGVAAQ